MIVSHKIHPKPAEGFYIMAGREEGAQKGIRAENRPNKIGLRSSRAPAVQTGDLGLRGRKVVEGLPDEVIGEGFRRRPGSLVPDRRRSQTGGSVVASSRCDETPSGQPAPAGRIEQSSGNTDAVAREQTG